MTDKEIKKKLAIIDGKLYSIMQALAVVVATVGHGNFDATVKRMNDDANIHSTQLLNDIEAQSLADGDE